jgi:hypothetical protein
MSQDFLMLRQNPKTKSGLEEVPVARQNVGDLQLLHDHHARQVGKGDIWFISKR